MLHGCPWIMKQRLKKCYWNCWVFVYIQHFKVMTINARNRSTARTGSVGIYTSYAPHRLKVTCKQATDWQSGLTQTFLPFRCTDSHEQFIDALVYAGLPTRGWRVAYVRLKEGPLLSKLGPHPRTQQSCSGYRTNRIGSRDSNKY